MSTVLVTGGSGFIGSHVVDRLIEAGHEPRIFDLRRSRWHPAVPAMLGDLGDLEELTVAMSGCSAVIHLAASADVDEVVADPVEAERRNASGTLRVLEAARRSGVERVVYASTIWTYSDTPADVHEESLPLHPPAHLYTATKLAGELYCHAYRELYGLDSTILRFGIPYGPRARAAAVVPTFIAKALAGEPLTIAGDGSQSRRFVYVEDLADGVVLSLCATAANRTYNLVGEEDTTIREIAEAVRAELGDVEIRTGPGRAADFAGAPVSGARAAAELGWVPSTPFAEGMRRCVEWHRTPQPTLPAAPARRSRAVVGAALAAVLVVALLAPWPPELTELRHGHAIVLAALLLTAVLAVRPSTPVRTPAWPSE